tara:strand:+ start:170 stop:865 length:696 start_codon:yes stop_codon:yes gene_type:complete
MGKDNDGGYLVEKKSIESSKALISFGINTDWSFEKDFSSINKGKIHAYDHTVNNNFFIKKIIKDFLKIFTGNFFLWIKSFILFKDYLSFFKNNNTHYVEKIGSEEGCTFLQKTIERVNENPIFLKIDIEGSEYRIMDEIIKNSKNISGMAIEFHDVDLHKERIKDFILNFPLELVHIHGNNFSSLDHNGDPLSLELTFAAKPVVLESEYKIPHNLDQKNNPASDEQVLNFN